MTGRNVAASVRAKLLNKARADKRDFTLVLTRLPEKDVTSGSKLIQGGD